MLQVWRISLERGRAEDNHESFHLDGPEDFVKQVSTRVLSYSSHTGKRKEN